MNEEASAGEEVV